MAPRCIQRRDNLVIAQLKSVIRQVIPGLCGEMPLRRQKKSVSHSRGPKLRVIEVSFSIGCFQHVLESESRLMISYKPRRNERDIPEKLGGIGELSARIPG